MASELSKKEFNTIFWRSFTLLGSFNYERMEGLGFLYAIMPSLKRIYKDDEAGYKEALHRHMEAFNMTVAPSPFVMGIAVAMEEQAKEDSSIDKKSINALKVSLMGPLSGIGDTFFWGIFRVLACSIGASFALQGNVLGPIMLLLLFNVPNFLTRYYGLKLGYGQGAGALENLQKSGKMDLFTYCAGIVGIASVGCLTAAWIGLSSPLAFSIAGNEIVIQEYLDQLCPQLLSLTAVLTILKLLKSKVSTLKITVGVIVVAFVLGTLGVIA